MCEEKTRRTKVVYLVSVWILTVTGIKVHSYTNCKWKVCLDFTNCEDIIDKKSLIYLESKAGERIDLATHWSFKAIPLPVLVAVGECSVAEKYHSLSFLSKDLRIEKKKVFPNLIGEVCTSSRVWGYFERRERFKKIKIKVLK